LTLNFPKKFADEIMCQIAQRSVYTHVITYYTYACISCVNVKPLFIIHLTHTYTYTHIYDK